MHVILLMFVFLSSSHAVALSGNVAIGGRYFKNEGLTSNVVRQGSMSANVKHEISVTEYGFIGLDFYARKDEKDPARDLFDVNKLFYTFEGDSYRLLVGNNVVHWGVVESQSVVNVINQKDVQDFPRGLRRLGQTMISLNVDVIDEWDVELYALTRHEPLKYSAPKYRLTTPFDARSSIEYEASNDEDHLDIAARISGDWRDLEYSFSYFSGTSREPILSVYPFEGQWRFRQFYPLVEQLGLESQFVSGEWLAKLEVATASGFFDRHSKFVVGYEYSFVGILDTDASIAFVGEYLFDDRKEKTPHHFEDDLFVGARIDANNINSSKLLLGIFVDAESDERIFTLEASSRFLESFLIKLRSQVYSHMPSPKQLDVMEALAYLSEGEKSAFLSREDFWEIIIEYHY